MSSGKLGMYGATATAEPLGSELTSPDLHPVFEKGNSPEGVSMCQEHDIGVSVIKCISAQVAPRGLARTSNEVEYPDSVGPPGLTHSSNDSFCAMSNGSLGTCTRDQNEGIGNMFRSLTTSFVTPLVLLNPL